MSREYFGVAGSYRANTSKSVFAEGGGSLLLGWGVMSNIRTSPIARWKMRGQLPIRDD